MQPNHKPAALEPDAIEEVLDGKPASSSDEAVRRVEETVAFLRTAPAPVARPGAIRDLMSRIETEERPQQGSFFGGVSWWGGALAASLLVGLFLLYSSEKPLVEEHALEGDRHELARAWLVEAQERDGHWDAGRWGGHPAHDVALTALSLIALLDDADPSPACRDAVYRAGYYLIHHLFHGTSRGSGARSNRLAALALIAAYQQFPLPDWHEPVRHASQTLLAGQTEAGGWGYVPWEDTGIQVALLDKEQIRMQTAQWLSTTQAENWERLGGTIYVMARTSLLL